MTAPQHQAPRTTPFQDFDHLERLRNRVVDSLPYGYEKLRINQCREYRRCRSRLCAICESEKYRIASEVLKFRLQLAPVCHQSYFLTLTFRDCCTEQLRQKATLLRKSFRTFMGTNEMRFSAGSFISLENTSSTRDQSMEHPHLHGVIAMRAAYRNHYMRQTDVQALWRRLSPEALSAELKPVRDIEATCRYVAKFNYSDFETVLSSDFDRLVKRRGQLHYLRTFSASGVLSRGDYIADQNSIVIDRTGLHQFTRPLPSTNGAMERMFALHRSIPMEQSAQSAEYLN